MPERAETIELGSGTALPCTSMFQGPPLFGEMLPWYSRYSPLTPVPASLPEEDQAATLPFVGSATSAIQYRVFAASA